MRPCVGLPRPDALGREQEVLVLLHVRRHIDHARRPDEASGRDRVAGVVGQVLAGDPVHRRVEVRARVLAHAERVPVPRRALVVEARDHFDRHAGRRRRRCPAGR